MAKISTYEEILQLHFVKKFDFPRPSIFASKWKDFELIENCINTNLNDKSILNKMRVLQFMSLHYSDLLLELETQKKFEKDDVNWYKFIIEQLDTSILSIQKKINLNTNRNKQIISELLSPLEGIITPYDSFIEYLEQYFNSGSFPSEIKSIKMKMINKKGFATLLNKIFIEIKSENDHLPFEYVSFFKKHISIFKDVKLSKFNYTKSTLYTYFKSNTILKLRKM
jgi:hypothetical protein